MYRDASYGYVQYTVLATSNQAPSGQLLMTDDQLDQLRQRLAAIHGKFAGLYGIGPGERFAMEIEFKITSDNVLAIKQARPWVFDDAFTIPPPGGDTADATLSALTLSDVTLAFDSATTGYTASVANDVDETTVTPTTNGAGATYAIKPASVTDADGVVPLAVGSNVITIEVTAEDGNASKTYTVTVTRADPASGPAVAIGLSPSGPVKESMEITLTMSFANLESDSDTSDVDYIFRADVVSRADGNSADVCEGEGIGSNRNFNQVDEDPEVRTGSISASCAPGGYAVRASISSPDNVELASASVDFTIRSVGQQPTPEPLSTDATLNGLSLSSVNIGAFDPNTVTYTAQVSNDVAETTVTATTKDDGATYTIHLNSVADADGIIPLAVGSNVITVEVTAEDSLAIETYTVTVTRAAPLSADATLSSLSLSNINFGAFDPATVAYTVSVGNEVVETTVTPTANDTGATHVVKIDGAEDGDRVIPLAVGSNVIIVEVTAEDGKTTKTYTVTVTRAEPPAPGPAVAVELSPSGSVEEGTEIALTMSFANLESDTDTSTTDYVFRADVVNADGCEGGGVGVDRNINKVDEEPEVRTGTISASCAPGDYTVEVSISSPSNVELASATADFTVNAPAEQQSEPPASTDATLSSLTLSDVTLAFASTTTGYTASVANDVDETTVTPTTNDGGASYVVKLGDAVDEDGTVQLSVGSNVIAIEVTAEDGKTAKTYIVTVNRDAPAEPEEPEPESTAERSAWLESNPENNPFVGEWQHFTLRGSELEKVDLSVNVIGFGGAPSSTGAVGYATASPPPAVGEVCESADYSGYQMSVDATFSLVGCREGTVVIELLDPGNDWALLKRYTVTVNAGP